MNGARTRWFIAVLICCPDTVAPSVATKEFALLRSEHHHFVGHDIAHLSVHGKAVDLARGYDVGDLVVGTERGKVPARSELSSIAVDHLELVLHLPWA